MNLVFYNENDPKMAAWLRELIVQGHIAPGVVDERSIEDIVPNELAGYAQCHFFAGIGGWSYALRLAGWPDDRPVWTGSCPCQPFSSAGKGAGFDDERHLWPAFFHLIQQCRPARVVGEQVASKDGLMWWDLVRTDLEGADYASGASDLCSAGATDSDLRQRIYWMANANSFAGDQRGAIGGGRDSGGNAQAWAGLGRGGELGRLADSPGQRHYRVDALLRPEEAGRNSSAILEAARSGEVSGMGHAELSAQARQREHGRQVVSEQEAKRLGLPSRLGLVARPVEWVACGDGYHRPIEPGTFPLADGVPARVVRLRGYGNVINPEVAAAFIEACFGEQAEERLIA